MPDFAVISSDSHVMEPAGLWETRLDAAWRDQAPRIVKNEEGSGFSFVAPGLPRQPVAGAFAAGKSGAAYKQHLENAGVAARSTAISNMMNPRSGHAQTAIYHLHRHQPVDRLAQPVTRC